ncbi:phosphate acyltransferase PlsX [Natranaerobius trueperi]|uniref:Phosphate acyltransferase n=1 Tax=Natranaerobius trueperi TaxID=759412 RepID=A0A226BYR8_9FIRM|nr:phosphate acyltransferase PlsX [Natranaerobius trueperi]OWZ84188.1 phosphate--acyl-ACP acyltransferase [Natranaerobius trueperi]
MTVRIAVDVMGGDNAPNAPLDGAIQAMQENDDIEIVLFGEKHLIDNHLDKKNIVNIKDRIHIDNTTEVITNDDNPTKAIKEKNDSSLIKAMVAVKNGEVDAMVSSGNTGAFMAGGLLKVGRLAKIKRPALAPVFPTFDGKGTIVLDVGATMDPKPENLKDFAIMGSLYVEKVLKRDLPKVGLINVGEEASKGNQLVKESYELLQTTGINFQGNIEARELLSGKVDVAVCEGFLGNVLLKFMEGFGKDMFNTMKNEFTSSLTGQLGAMLLKPNLKNLKNRFDYSEYGGAPFLGINGILVKSHGSSDDLAIKNAINKQSYHLAKENILTAFSEEIMKGVE